MRPYKPRIADERTFMAVADSLRGEPDSTRVHVLAALMDRIGVPMLVAQNFRDDLAVRELFASRGVTLLDGDHGE